MSWRIVNLRPLHSGGNGDVFIGQRTDNGDQVVVKYLREHRMMYARKAFAREARFLARGFRGLIPLLSWDMNAERPYYVMPYLNGGPLSQYAGRLRADQIQAVAIELARTLSNLHAAYEVHGDFKPDNVLLKPDGQLKVADPLGNGTIFTVLFSQNHGGTPGYWAPEVGAGGSISYPGDVYSYGATLYELVTGQRPRDGQRLDPGAEGYHRAPKIWEIIAACCQIDPGARPTMQEVLRMLRGERWASILATRLQREELAAACVIGCIVFVLLGAVFTTGSR